MQKSVFFYLAALIAVVSAISVAIIKQYNVNLSYSISIVELRCLHFIILYNMLQKAKMQAVRTSFNL